MMDITQHTNNAQTIAEAHSEEVLIASVEDGLDLMGTLYFQGYDAIILHEEALVAEFFDLKTGMAGEILQKFSNYRMRLAIVGDFTRYESRSLQQFILESNKGKQVCFVNTVSEAIERLTSV